MQCLLCGSFGEPFYLQEFHLCGYCGAIFRPHATLLDPQDEKNRYLLHSDDPSDRGYQKFVMPLVEKVVSRFKLGSHGIDFGTGRSQIVAKLLETRGMKMEVYDPFFYPDRTPLAKEYDFVTACEVIEHFYRPYEEFVLLRKILKQNGVLLCMTHLYDPSIDFARWYYKNDPTHVCIYQEKTIKYIANRFKFRDFSIEDRVIGFFL